MAAETVKGIVQRLFGEVLNGGDLDVIDELFGSECVFHTPFNPDGTSEGFKQFISLVRTAFPDVKYTVEDRKIADEGDKVMVRWEARGTHQGELLGIAPTGRQIVVTGLLFVFGHTETQWDRGGREHTWTIMVNEVWADWGGLSLLQQLGLTPQEQTAQTSR
jgi:predicted ester cyclase